jgi:nicotinate-nucleotide adenylyltransferase
LLKRPKKISPQSGGTWGIVGGTFNPIHLGHLILAESVRQTLNADGMLFVPARKHPLKSSEVLESTYPDRVTMVDLAIDSNPHFVREDPPENSEYTIDLVAGLRTKYPGAAFFLTMGADIIPEFDRWHRHLELVEMIDIVIADRPGWADFETKGTVLYKARRVHIPQYDISASGIREQVRSGRQITYLVPEAVETYIIEHGLYAEK